ncbi:hypothetical protein Z517_05175 [Fonsecaea pedrosoi CBS 271.37]|uniref:Unplaced genomic scaffold supercont1.3, whole genome shotgun sequence n=1 Tax=Fonsecaea pedrosoi CBS 271.37 TaxID=1442368 RepID=A0A0D2GMG2_9EURO|nr:uncharacterized protein Z517_05175 [Fonsecaea pedrosoi CBS 271.37]KIW82148.1 hypothetical protein Z517_05175 [Fonsecaea pedrosoi CBS 271.37]
MAEPQAARARYLQQAARMIFLSAPTTSRQLLREGVELDHAASSHAAHRDIATLKSTHMEESQQPLDVPVERSEAVVTESTDPVLEKPTKSSSKKRAKARKGREGLQALLNKSMQSKSTPGLNLMDLMKK